jgi:hypothetical protein
MPADKKPPLPSSPDAKPPAPASDAEVAGFVRMMEAATPAPIPASGSGERGRLIFAMDATASRQPAWDMALRLQGDMFAEVAATGGLDVQLVYFRGFNECRASRWASTPEMLAQTMRVIACEGGYTQIGKVLAHARRETERHRVNALVYVGDSMEEDIDHLAALAGELGLLNVPAFLFHEGYDNSAETAFREIARLTKGAYCRFDAGSAEALRDLLRAAAAYAAGGCAALERLSQRGGQARRLLEQLKS